ncbi:histone H3-K79 methyltransferase [Phytophthora cactorum]|nr:histone H3-K79 methyltransferase [Phytophthora cactorum]
MHYSLLVAMRTSFQDWKDKALVSIALQFDKEVIRITWSYVARRMAKSKRTGSELRLRLTSLKRTYGKTLSRFPPCFFTSSIARTRLHSNNVINCAAVQGGARPGVISARAALLLLRMLGDVNAEDVRHQAGRTQDNAGEILPDGISKVIDTIGPLDATDVFYYIGAGIVVCVGMETRGDLCGLATKRVEQHVASLPLLGKVTMKAVSVRDSALSALPPTCNATVIFANMFLFEEAAKLVVSRELCEMRRARIVVLTSLFCPLHRWTRTQPFCQRWSLMRKVEVQCSLKAALYPIYVYMRKQ